MNIDTALISEAVYGLCVRANTLYDGELYKKIAVLSESSGDIKYQLMLENIKLAYHSKRPLCQDTGVVIVFLKIPGGAVLSGRDINDAVNDGVEKAYTENFYRKSIVEDALFDRTNTSTNTPAVIYYEHGGDEFSVELLVKGAGAENYSAVKMFQPSDSEDDICAFIKNTIVEAGEKVCPPVVLGIGIGGTMDYAAVLSKKAFFVNESPSTVALKNKIAGLLKEKVLDIRILTAPSHIASLPVAVTINCHCTRHAGCKIIDGKIVYSENVPDFAETKIEFGAQRVNTSEIRKIRSLAQGTDILLSGEIYTARDAAHARFLELSNNGQNLPVDLKNKLIFYAGPCPAKEGEVIGPIGPTTSARMNKYADWTFSTAGALGIIGKGECPPLMKKFAMKNQGRYFSAAGGISCILAKCVLESEVIAFGELGTESVRRLVVKDLPLRVEI